MVNYQRPDLLNSRPFPVFRDTDVILAAGGVTKSFDDFKAINDLTSLFRNQNPSCSLPRMLHSLA